MKSPCIGICRLEDGRCVGCHRTGDQIARWAYMTDGERETIMRGLVETYGTGPDPAVLRPRGDPISEPRRQPAAAALDTALGRAAAEDHDAE